ncbi:MAG: hypothetical protein WD738_03230 [Pirellulales bacterium]
MKLKLSICVTVVAVVALIGRNIYADPPFFGTIFIDPDIIVASDPTTFQGVTYAGQGLRLMFDRRVNDWTTVNAYLFDASFDDGLSIEIQVNPEFGSSDDALIEAETYGAVIGQLPTALRADVETVWIHQGTELFGGGNNNLLIHTGQADLYAADGILEETFVHEASHTSLDATHAAAPGWLAAQEADGEFISVYARDYPDREDIAESFLPYLAVRYRSDRISQSLLDTIVQTIPNRIDYFDAQSFDMYPLVTVVPGDYNDDGVVDAADYVVWRKHNNTMTTLPNDSTPGEVNDADYNQWRAHFGQTAGAGATGSASANPAVPEPTSILLLLIGVMLFPRLPRYEFF